MDHTLEKIKSHLETRNYLTAGTNYLGLKREFWPKFGSELYPLAHDYYHDLNPFFGFNAVNFDFFKSFPVVTLRDGAFPLGIFFVNHFQKLQKTEQILLIHEKLSHFAPLQIQSNLLTYKMVQPKRINIEDAKQIILIGVLSDQMIQDQNAIWKKLDGLKSLNSQTKIKIYLQTRKNPFEAQYSDSNHVNSFLFKLYQELKIPPKFLTTNELFNLGMLKDAYVINLQSDLSFVADNFTDYLLSSKGATIHEWSGPTNKDHYLTRPVSLYHHMEINQLNGPSIFNELIFLRKKATQADPYYDGYLLAKFKELYLGQ